MEELRKYFKTFGEMEKVMFEAHEEGKVLHGGIIFTADSFSKEYSELSRTYLFTSNAKAFNPKASGYSIFANCADGSEDGVRIDYYMKSEGWKVEKSFIEMEK